MTQTGSWRTRRTAAAPVTGSNPVGSASNPEEEGFVDRRLVPHPGSLEGFGAIAQSADDLELFGAHPLEPIHGARRRFVRQPRVKGSVRRFRRRLSPWTIMRCPTGRRPRARFRRGLSLPESNRGRPVLVSSVYGRRPPTGIGPTKCSVGKPMKCPAKATRVPKRFRLELKRQQREIRHQGKELRKLRPQN